MNRKKFDDVFDLEIAVDMYFMACDDTGTPYTVEGLACALDMDRRSLLNYGKMETHKECHPVVQRAKRRILQDFIERGLQSKKNPALIIFLLKNNFGYVDKTETDVTARVDPVAQSSLNTLSLEQLEAIEGIITPSE